MTTGDSTAVPPSELCYSVSDFMDGELSEADAVSFRHHLAHCDFCSQQLGEGWLLDQRMKPRRKPVPKLFRWKVPVLVPAGLAAVLMAVVAAVLVARRGTTPDLEITYRGAKARLANKPYHPLEERAVLSNRPSGPALSLKNADQLRALADHIKALERKKDDLAAANTLVEWGLADQAVPYLDRIPSSADKYVLASAIMLEKKEADPEQALEMADRALRQRPGYAPALWNRGLALLRLKLPAAAERDLQEVAGQREEGWSNEAAREAGSAREQFEKRHQTYLEENRACRRMIETGEPIPEALALSAPGLSRACLYKAVRAARSADQVTRLLPLAKRLDALDGGDWLKKYATQVAAKSFAARGPLAEKYRPLALGELPDEQVPALLETLRRSRESDMLLGALGDVPPALGRSVNKEYREVLDKAAAATGDPWLLMLSQEEKAVSTRRDGDDVGALTLLNRATADCGAHKPVRAVDVRCAMLRRQLMRVYTEMSRTTEAREQGAKALELASLANEWGLEIKLLGDLAFAEGVGGTHGALALGFFNEAIEREPDGCSAPPPITERRIDWDVIQSGLASEHLRGLDFASAKKDLDGASKCRRSSWLSRSFVKADLARRYPPTPEEITEFNKALAFASSTMTGGNHAMALHVQGRFLSVVDPVAGRQMLRQAIGEAEKLPDDGEASKARTYSYTTLILAAGKSRAYDEALSLFGEELRTSLPKNCVLAVAAEDERTLLVARGPTGTIQGYYDDKRTERPETAPGLVPEAFLHDALRGCASVRVMARPPLFGMPGLLPDDLAWSYFGGTVAGASSTSRGGTTLVVTSPSPPQELGLRSFEPISFEAQVGPEVVKLQGPDATPERVLEEWQRASIIYFHAHGMITDSADAAVLVLSLGPGGNYLLTESMIRAKKLPNRPIIILIACDGGHAGTYLHQVSSLPAAFLEAGAGLVFAATTQIPTDAGPRFFSELMEKIRAGADPAVALRDAKQAWRKKGDQEWVQQVLLFQASAD